MEARNQGRYSIYSGLEAMNCSHIQRPTERTAQFDGIADLIWTVGDGGGFWQGSIGTEAYEMFGFRDPDYPACGELCRCLGVRVPLFHMSRPNFRNFGFCNTSRWFTYFVARSICDFQFLIG
jgi:hypothetical protein